MNPILRPMNPDELASYFEVGNEEYIAEQMLAGRTREAAQANSDETMRRTMVDGVLVGGNEVFTVQLGDERIGVLWIAPRDGENSWWIYDIELAPEFRGRGLGRATMLLAEEAVRERGGSILGLNVFGHNSTARSLYDSLGYQPTSIQMSKPL
jgi:ribosomal protein S18 acetylase RimI-like enzyme